MTAMTLQASAPEAIDMASGLVQEEAAGIRLLRRPGPGGSRPLILLHGIGSNAASWTGMMAAFPPTTEIIAWNAPGYGGSQRVALAEPSPDDYADRLNLMLSALGLSRVTLVGHSLGCLFAARFAATRPETVACLALLSPALGYATPAGSPLPDSVQARTDELRALGSEAFAARRADRLVHRPEAKPAVATAVRRAMASVDPVGYGQAVRALGAGDLLADAARLRLKVLVAVGAEDVVTPPANARALYGALDAATRTRLTADGPVLVRDAGHALPQEQPRIVADLLHAFAGAVP